MFSFIKFGEPYNSTWGGTTVMATLELNEIIDGYDYHDFPSSEWLFLSKESIDEAIKELLEIKKRMLNFEKG